ncbi:jg18657 [Pararge aegeria aegeria]|uniref:Jg18657 protein n=1 Tax=Pararge aegeria aegeria TaxID=348720 RepID=A0A8S4REZ6_9NEOP|nr:jg18657 [Pararge aegeria aegeria]
MDVEVPTGWNGSPELVTAALVDPQRGVQTTLSASQVAAGSKRHRTVEFGTPHKRLKIDPAVDKEKWSPLSTKFISTGFELGLKVSGLERSIGISKKGEFVTCQLFEYDVSGRPISNLSADVLKGSS